MNGFTPIDCTLLAAVVGRPESSRTAVGNQLQNATVFGRDTCSVMVEVRGSILRAHVTQRGHERFVRTTARNPGRRPDASLCWSSARRSPGRNWSDADTGLSFLTNCAPVRHSSVYSSYRSQVSFRAAVRTKRPRRTQVLLQYSQVDARFQQVSRVGMSQAVHADLARELKFDDRSTQCSLHSRFTHRLPRTADHDTFDVHLRKQQCRMAMRLPVLTQHFECGSRQRHESILRSLPAVHVNPYPL